jgi:hypothetical protein
MQQIVVNLKTNLKENNIDEEKQNIETLKNEFSGRHKWTNTIPLNFDIEKLSVDNIDLQTVDSIYKYINSLKSYFINYRNKINDENNNFKRNYEKTHKVKLADIRIIYHNDKLSDFMTSTVSGKGAFIVKNKIYRDWQPIYDIPETYFFKAQFYAPFKPFFGKLIDTFWFNVIVIWISTIFLIIILYYRILQRFIETFDIIKKRFKHRKEAKYHLIKPIKRKSKWKKFLDRYS